MRTWRELHCHSLPFSAPCRCPNQRRTRVSHQNAISGKMQYFGILHPASKSNAPSSRVLRSKKPRRALLLDFTDYYSWISTVSSPGPAKLVRCDTDRPGSLMRTCEELLCPELPQASPPLTALPETQNETGTCIMDELMTPYQPYAPLSTLGLGLNSPRWQGWAISIIPCQRSIILYRVPCQFRYPSELEPSYNN